MGQDLILYLRASVKHLLLIFNSVLINNAYANFGSQVNCISEAYAEKIGATNKIEWVTCMFTLLLKG